MDKPKLLTKWKSARGRVVAQIKDTDSYVVIRFEDGSYMAIEYKSGWEGEIHIKLMGEPPDAYSLYLAGVLSEEEWRRSEARRESEWKVEQEKNDRDLLRKLQAKYGDVHEQEVQVREGQDGQEEGQDGRAGAGR